MVLLSPRSPAPPHASDLPDRFLLTADHYVNPRWWPIEQETIFRRTWLYVGDCDRLPESGMVWAKPMPGVNLLITRDQAGTLRAFQNVCPHRAALLVPKTGVRFCKQVVCPYHAWVYDLAGNLVGTPAQNQFSDSFHKSDFALRPVRLETWAGFIFVCLDDQMPPLASFLGSIPENLSQYRTHQTCQLAYKRYPVACNWKNYHDNTLCDYHVAIAHRTTLHQAQGPVRHYQHQFEAYVNLLYTPTTAAWRENHQPLSHLPDRCREGFFTYGIYPNLHLLAFPNGLLAWIQIEPLTPSTCQVNLEIYGDPQFSPAPDALLADFEAFMQEDMALTESVQQGYASGAYTPGPVNGLEARIVHQQRLIQAAIAPNP